MMMLVQGRADKSICWHGRTVDAAQCFSEEMREKTREAGEQK
jgi:hypothetical protein